MISLKNIKENGGIKYSITTTDNILDPEISNDYYGSKDFIRYLKDEFDIYWLNMEKTKIIEAEKGKIIKFFNDDQNFLLLKICIEKGKAFLLDRNEKLVFEFIIDPLDKFSFLICEFRSKKIEDHMKERLNNIYFKEQIFFYVSELVNKILSYDSDIQNKTYFKSDKERISTLKILALDKNFSSYVTKVKKQFDIKYNNFINLVN